jgi:aminoglycoside phosphotransferase (APT) family kinase protein
VSPIVPPELAPVRPGEQLDWPALARWLRPRLAAALPGVDGPLEVLQFPNGAANLTYLLRIGAHELVRAYVFGDDPAVLGAEFFVMERRRGEVVRTSIPPALASHPDVGRRISFALVDAMADLHALDPTTCDLSDLGKPDGFVERQLSGWLKRWQLSRFDDSPAAMDEIHAELVRETPRPARASIVHNDLKLDNCQIDPANPDRVSAIFDWDMATLGDPLADLGTLLNYWPDPADPPDAQRGSHAGLREMGLPPRGDIVARYARRSGGDVAAVRWWEAFALWKTVVVVQQLHRRWVRGESKDPRMARIADRVPSLIAAARAALTRA